MQNSVRLAFEKPLNRHICKAWPIDMMPDVLFFLKTENVIQQNWNQFLLVVKATALMSNIKNFICEF